MEKISSAMTQLSQPRLSAVLPRERLFEQLDELRSHSMLWIGGSPGAGKTTLIASYLEERRLPAVWFAVQPAHAEPETLLASLQVAGTDSEAPITEVIAKRGPGLRSDPAGSGSRLLRDLYHRLPRPAVLVFEDCHRVASDAWLHKLLVDSAGDIPRGLHIVLIGRGEPPGVYTRLIASRTVGVLDPRDLCLTRGETRALASEIVTQEPELEALHSACGGWAAGVAVTLERMRRSGTHRQNAVNEMRKTAFDYFAGEVFDRATREERRVLVSTALVPRVSASLAEELGESSRAQPLLQRLASHQLFTHRTTASPPTYEYTSLFREFLLTRLEETLEPPELTATVSRASVILEQSGELDASAELQLRMQNWDALLRLICRHGMRLLAQGEVNTLRRWIAAFPTSIAADSPWLAYWSGAAAISDNPVAARAQFENAWKRFEETADAVGQMLAAAAALETFQFEWSSFEAARLWIDRLETRLASGPIYPSLEIELRVTANLLFALTQVRPNARLSANCIARLRALLDSEVDVNHRLFAARSMLLAFCSSTHVESANHVSARMRSMLQEPRCSSEVRASALSAIAYSLWFEGAFAEADSALQEAISAGETHPSTSRDPLHHLTSQLIAFSRRDVAAIADCARALRPARDPTCHLGMSLLARIKAEQATLRGDPAAAATHLVAAVSQADEACAQPLRWLSRLTLIGCLAAQGDCAHATRVLQQARGLADEEVSEGWLHDHELLAACVALRAGDRSECHRLLNRALSTPACAPVASQIFGLLPTLAAELCTEALRCGIAADSVRALIQRYRLPPPANAGDDWPWSFKVFVLGRFRVLKGDSPIRFSRRAQRKPLELLQALIAFGGTEVGATVLTDALWPDSEGDAGYHALESALHRLRHLLGAPSALTMAGGKLSLNRQQFWVDMWAVERELRTVGARGAAGAERLTRMRELYTGHFLEHEPEKSWAVMRRQLLREKFVRCVRELARAYESQRLWQEAASVYQTGLELDSLAEDLHRGLIVCHRELGDHAEALRAYRHCRELLMRVLGVQPNGKTLAIYQSVTQNAVGQTG